MALKDNYRILQEPYKLILVQPASTKHASQHGKQTVKVELRWGSKDDRAIMCHGRHGGCTAVITEWEILQCIETCPIYILGLLVLQQVKQMR